MENINKHWCMRDIDYDQIHFFPGPVKNTSTAKTSKQVQQNGNNLSSETRSPETRPCNGQTTPVDRNTLGDISLEDATKARLREAILDKRKHGKVPQILARWPTDTLRLCDVVNAEECQRAFGNFDVLWTQLFHGLLILNKQHCQLTHLDLSGFPHTNGLLYTVLQLVPLLTLTADNLDKQTIYDMVVSKLDADDEGLLTNLEIFLDKVLGHPVFHTSRRLVLPKGRLNVVLDCFPISADKLSYICLLTAMAIQPISNVRFDVKRIAFKYKEPGPEFVPIDPLLPLQLIKKVIEVWNLDGISMSDIPDGQSFEVLSRQHLQQFSSLSKLSVADCRLDLTAHDKREEFVNGLSRLKHLNRLDLSTCDLSEHLREVLEALQRPLEYLSISCCRLQKADLDSLAHSKHSQSLKDLDVSNIHADGCETLRPTRPPSGRQTPRSHTHIPVPRESTTHLPRDSGVYDDSSSTASLSTVSAADTGVSVRLPLECIHSVRDQELFSILVTNLPAFTELVSVDVSNHAFHFRLDKDLLCSLADSLQQLTKLKRATFQDLPLWDDCIVSLLEHLMDLPDLQNISFSRSLDAPNLSMHDKLCFWKKVHKLKQGRRLKLDIANFTTDSIYASMPDSEDDVWSEYSSIGTYSEVSSPRDVFSPRSPRY